MCEAETTREVKHSHISSKQRIRLLIICAKYITDIETNNDSSSSEIYNDLKKKCEQLNLDTGWVLEQAKNYFKLFPSNTLQYWASENAENDFKRKS